MSISRRRVLETTPTSASRPTNDRSSWCFEGFEMFWTFKSDPWRQPLILFIHVWIFRRASLFTCDFVDLFTRNKILRNELQSFSNCSSAYGPFGHCQVLGELHFSCDTSSHPLPSLGISSGFCSCIAFNPSVISCHSSCDNTTSQWCLCSIETAALFNKWGVYCEPAEWNHHHPLSVLDMDPKSTTKSSLARGTLLTTRKASRKAKRRGGASNESKLRKALAAVISAAHIILLLTILAHSKGDLRSTETFALTETVTHTQAQNSFSMRVRAMLFDVWWNCKIEGRTNTVSG